MEYPESFPASLNRFSSFFFSVSGDEFKKNQKELIIMVSHGNSVQSFMDLYDVDSKQKDIIGVPYCCVSIVKRQSNKTGHRSWELVMIGDS